MRPGLYADTCWLLPAMTGAKIIVLRRRSVKVKGRWTPDMDPRQTRPSEHRW